MAIKYNQIAFLGLGKMANKMISRITNNVYNNVTLHGFSPSQRQIKHVLTHPSINETLNRELDYIIYAFKPQNWDQNQRKAINLALKQTTKKPIIISIIAGLGIAELDCDIVTMPSFLCEVGHSFMFAHAKENFTKAQKFEVEVLFENMGPIFWVNSASQMHIAVASSGSAPAYVLFAMDMAIKIYELSGISKLKAKQDIINSIKIISDFFKTKIETGNEIIWEECYQELVNKNQQIFILRIIEAYCNAMHKLGLDMKIAYNIAWNTVLGTALLVEQNPETELTSMIENIMSKGGTTEKAINVAKTINFEIFKSQDNLNDFVFSILHAAYNQSIFLQEQSKKKAKSIENQSIFKENIKNEIDLTKWKLDIKQKNPSL